MTDTFELTLNNPLTEEQWDMIADVDFDHTDRIWFHTKHGKEVEFTKARHGRWISRPAPSNSYCGYLICSNCGEEVSDADEYNYCPNCGARMSGDD